MTTDITFDMARGLLPARPENSHKGTYGHVFVIAGAPGFTLAVQWHPEYMIIHKKQRNLFRALVNEAKPM